MGGGEPITANWIYIGEGEWTQIDGRLATQNMKTIPKESAQATKWLRSLDKDISNHHEVWEKGYPNRFGARIPVESRWNLELLEELLQGYQDKEIVEWLRYGWPTGRLPGLADPKKWGKNHKGAEEHPKALQDYVNKELKHKAIIGLFEKIPFQDKVGISPLSTRAKKNSQERRVILDLSFPIGEGINDGIPKDTYLGLEAKLTFPKTDDFACL